MFTSCSGGGTVKQFVDVGSSHRDLCLALRITPLDLRTVVRDVSHFCKLVQVPRRRASQRPRSTWEARDPLRRLQRQLALWLRPVHNNLGAHVAAFKKNSSPFANASRHVGGADTGVVVADIAGFFDAISISNVVSTLQRLGASEQVAVTLARLNTIDDRLMQGGRASPYIANFAASDLDGVLLRRIAAGCTYTRYVDDISISGPLNVLPDPSELTRWIADANFTVRLKSARLFTRAQGPYVTGLQVGGDCPRLPRRFRRKIERLLHFAEKYDLASSARLTLGQSVEAAKAFFDGACHWAEPIDRDLVKEWRRRFGSLPSLP